MCLWAEQKLSSKEVKDAKFHFLTSVHLMTFPFALYSDPWNIFTLVIDSMDFPSMGLMTLKQRQKERDGSSSKLEEPLLLSSLLTNYTGCLAEHVCKTS